MEIGLDFGGQAGKGCPHVFGDARRQRPPLAKPETAHMRCGVFSPHHPAKLVHTIDIARLGVEQLDDTPKVIGEVATRQVSRVEIPNSGAAGEITSARPGVEYLAFAVRSLRRNWQDGREIGRIKLVPCEPQGGIGLR